MKNIFKQIIVYILIQEARLILWRYKPNIIAVTGSVGKTSTKDAIYSVLSKKFFVRKSEKSYNSEIGLPLTIIGCRNAWNNPFLWSLNILKGLKVILFGGDYPKWLVLEVGADRPGDIKGLSKWLRTDIAVITRIGKVPVHVEFFKSQKEVFEEKASILATLKEKGKAILNIDDEDIATLKDKTNKEVVTVSSFKHADITASNYQVSYAENSGLPEGIMFRVDYRGSSIPISIKGVLGEQHIYPILNSVGVGLALGLNAVEINESLSNHASPRGRMRVIEGIGGSCVVDDTYNSSPIALSYALKTLAGLKTKGRKIAVLGDMLELGKFSSEEHEKMGLEASKSVNILITVGLRSKRIAESAQMAGLSKENIFEFDSSITAGEFLKEKIGNGDIILVKGSQSMRMEKVVEKIMAHPEQAEELLVRQEREWKDKN